MVNTIKNIVSRVDAQKPRELDSKVANSASKSDSSSVVSVDSVKVSEAASSQILSKISQNPPINSEAVSRIKDAIAEGKYPVDIDQISDALMDAYRDLKT